MNNNIYSTLHLATLSKAIALISLICFFGTNSFASKETSNSTFYKKHIVIVVDQTIQQHPNTLRLYDALVELLRGGDMQRRGLDASSKWPKDFFNESTDEISLFAFDILGSGNPLSYDYADIHRIAKNKRISEDQMNKLIISRLIHYRTSFRKSGKNIDDFLAEDLKRLFDKNDPLYQQISQSRKAVSLPSLVDQSILDFLDTLVTIPATQYDILIVSDFMAGDGQSTKKDQEILEQMLGGENKYIESFKIYLNSISAPFSKNSNEIVLRYKSDMKSPSVSGGKLNVQVLSNTSLQVSNFSLKQKKWGGELFKVPQFNLLFAKNENIKVKEIALSIKDNLGNQVSSQSLCSNDDVDKSYNNNYYIFSNQNVKLPDASVGKEYTFEFIFYSDIVDESGNTIIPMAFTTSMPVILATTDFKSAPKENLPWSIALSVLLLAIAVIVLYKIWDNRGKKRIMKVSRVLTPIGPTKYMDVKNEQVTNYDCWYKNDAFDKQRYIVIDYTIIPQKMRFARKYKYAFSYKVEDIDGNDTFSFRPEGLKSDGDNKENGKVYMNTPFGCDESQHMESLRIVAYQEPNKDPDFTFDNILKMKITVTIERIDNSSKQMNVTKDELFYSFIVRPKENLDTNVWIAFDPGTTGSCIAYGVASNIYDINDLQIVDNENGGIIPSVVHIPDNSVVFTNNYKTEDLNENRDFYCGERADQETINKFQSIKKLLGYKSSLEVEDDHGNKVYIKGQDLAHLLVRGLYSKLEKEVINLDDRHRTIRDMFVKGGDFIPQRAVVAIPNNYTLGRIQDMIDSIKRLDKFKEIHYLYESEAVLMTYLRQEIRNNNILKNHIAIVFDMGGATINATAFKLSFEFEQHKNIKKINVDTLAKIGYCVGGDDIDFAIIQFIYNIPSVKNIIGEEQQDKHQQNYKNILIQVARKIKIDWIQKYYEYNTEDNCTTDINVFWNYLKSVEYQSELLFDLSEITNEDEEYIRNESSKQSYMNKYVFSQIRDAVGELMTSLVVTTPDFTKEKISLIMSGRSILYPNVKESVVKGLKKYSNNIELWIGFNDEHGRFDDIKVKTAVAEGACWYAMYSSQFELKHNRVTSTFGYIDQDHAKNVFVPIISRGTEFGSDGTICDDAIPMNSCLRNVRFVQMLGSDYQNILDNDIRHKMNRIEEIRSDEILSKIEKIEFEVDERDNYDYTISVVGLSPINRSSRRNKEIGIIKSEIADEQSKSYVFSTIDTNNRHHKATYTKNRSTNNSKSTRI